LLLSRSSPLSAASSCPLFFSFFLDGSVHHRVLHSFPTRRSSDLRVPSVRDHSVSNPEKAPAAAPRPLPESQSGWTETVRCDYQSDRKSTRLNSSHVKISYAVFCLKKKKTTTQRHRAASTTAPASR